jgi:hypothetical protein
MADVALSAVNLVLNSIRHETQLQRRVRGDVQFIMDELESMNEVLRAMTNQGGCEYQQRPWMKQIMKLAFDSTNFVELYMQSHGREQEAAAGFINGAGTNVPYKEHVIARLWRLPWLPPALLAKRRVVNQIRKLKVRAQEISERQARYTVPAVPTSNTKEEKRVVISRRWHHDDPHRTAEPDTKSISMDCTAELVKWLNTESKAPPVQLLNAETEAPSAAMAKAKPSQGQAPLFGVLGRTAELVQWLKAETKAPSAATANAEPSQVQEAPLFGVLAIIAQDGADGSALTQSVYEHYDKTSGKEGPFERVVHVSVKRPPLPMDVILDMLRKIEPSGDYDRSIRTEDSKRSSVWLPER